MTIDLFRCQMSPDAGRAIADLYTPDEDGRIYCGQGPRTDEFEREFAKVVGLEHNALGVNSCSSALDLASYLIGIGEGDEVIISPQTCSATISSAVVNRGASIVWADIDQTTGNILPASVARLMTDRVKAVVAIDWAGRACDYAALRAATYLPGSVPVPIIEDAAHCLYIAPQHGDMVAWSFGPIKHLSCGGAGGALYTPSESYKRAELLRWHGLDRHSSEDFRCAQNISESGMRYHMTDDMAVVGLANLDLAVRSAGKARQNAEWYCRVFKNMPGLDMPPYDPTCNYWIFTLLAHDRDGLKEHLATAGIASSQVHARTDRHTAFKEVTSRQDRDLPGVDYFDQHQLAIPVGSWITEAEREYIASAVIDYATQHVLVHSL